jgi:hypothetical protein
MYRVEIAPVDDFDKVIPLEITKKYEIFSFHFLTFIRLKLRSNDIWQLSPLKFEKIKHGFKTLAECGDIRGVDNTSSFQYQISISFPFAPSNPRGQLI